jgi:hypothetical protein
VLPAIIVSAYQKTEDYNSQRCDGTLDYTETNTRGLSGCAHAEAHTYTVDSTGNRTSTQVKLIFPPLPGSSAIYILCKDIDDAKKWLGGLSGAEFKCLVDSESSDGFHTAITAQLDSIGWWGFFLFCGCAIWLAFFWLVWACGCTSCYKKTCGQCCWCDCLE